MVCEFEGKPERIELERIKRSMTESLGLMWDAHVFKNWETGKRVVSYTDLNELKRDFSVLRTVPIDVYDNYHVACHVLRAFEGRKKRSKDKPIRSTPETLLNAACAAGMNTQVISWLIEDCRAKNCWDAVSKAAKHGHNDVIDFVVAKFNNVYGDWEKSKAKFSDDFEDNWHCIKNWDPLISAAMGGQNATIDHLAEKYDLSPNGRVDTEMDRASLMDLRRDDVYVIIHKAAARDQTHTVEHLLDEYDYSPTTFTYWDETVLDVAISCGAKRTARFLKERGAKAGWELWSIDEEELEDDDAVDDVPEDILEQLNPGIRKVIEFMINLPTDEQPPVVWAEARKAFEFLRKQERLAARIVEGREEDGYGVCGQNDLAFAVPGEHVLRRVWRKLGGSFLKSSDGTYSGRAFSCIAEYKGDLEEANMCPLM